MRIPNCFAAFWLDRAGVRAPRNVCGLCAHEPVWLRLLEIVVVLVLVVDPGVFHEPPAKSRIDYEDEDDDEDD